MDFGQKNFREIDLVDVTSFFWPGFFKIFWPNTIFIALFFEKNLAHWLFF